MIEALLAISRQGKPRVVRFFNDNIPVRDRSQIISSLAACVIDRPAKSTNTLDFQHWKVVYKRYASLYFIVLADQDDNTLLHLELIHHYVEVLDKYFGNVCELDLIFNTHKALFLIDEIFVGGTIAESSKKVALRSCQAQDSWMSEADSKNKSPSL